MNTKNVLSYAIYYDPKRMDYLILDFLVNTYYKLIKSRKEINFSFIRSKHKGDNVLISFQFKSTSNKKFVLEFESEIKKYLLKSPSLLKSNLIPKKSLFMEFQNNQIELVEGVNLPFYGYNRDLSAFKQFTNISLISFKLLQDKVEDDDADIFFLILFFEKHFKLLMKEENSNELETHILELLNHFITQYNIQKDDYNELYLDTTKVLKNFDEDIEQILIQKENNLKLELKQAINDLFETDHFKINKFNLYDIILNQCSISVLYFIRALLIVKFHMLEVKL
ncbi:hypothetical protein KZP23_17085 [Echinicola marina]|uniref:hypothetical protein n=1 Tax=Echinicola marina TaxID=2859768 RepID=UPI001CF613C2|nr:hypothetical protein [Echinicola marina]UCS92400.1 hypothetical protein KZP23_17085 [Echinicola marina]